MLVDPDATQFIDELLQGFLRPRVATDDHQQLARCELRIPPPQCKATDLAADQSAEPPSDHRAKHGGANIRNDSGT
ncbi:hypothetical protein D9M70_449830 [compost metagenome]